MSEYRKASPSPSATNKDAASNAALNDLECGHAYTILPPSRNQPFDPLPICPACALAQLKSDSATLYSNGHGDVAFQALVKNSRLLQRLRGMQKKWDSMEVAAGQEWYERSVIDDFVLEMMAYYTADLVECRDMGDANPSLGSTKQSAFLGRLRSVVARTTKSKRGVAKAVEGDGKSARAKPISHNGSSSVEAAQARPRCPPASDVDSEGEDGGIPL